MLVRVGWASGCFPTSTVDVDDLEGAIRLINAWPVTGVLGSYRAGQPHILKTAEVYDDGHPYPKHVSDEGYGFVTTRPNLVLDQDPFEPGVDLELEVYDGYRE